MFGQRRALIAERARMEDRSQEQHRRRLLFLALQVNVLKVFRSMITFGACVDCDCRFNHHQEEEQAQLQERQEDLDALMKNKPADLKDFSMQVAQLSVLCPIRKK